jgi:GNAT superfamily N-acetyltransferase
MLAPLFAQENDMSHLVRLRQAVTADYAAWRLLWDAYLVFYNVAVPEGVTQSTWARCLDAASTMNAVVAEHDGALVGFAIYVVHPCTWRAGDICYLEDLFVTPAQRGTGTGRALIDYLHTLCVKNNWARLYWHTNTTNTTARKLYDRYTPADDVVRYVVEVSG